MIKHNHNEKIKPKRVVILGTGFIGKNLEKKLVSNNINILAISRQQLDLSEENSSEILIKLLREDDVIVFTSIVAPYKGKGIDPFVKNIKIAQNVCKALEKVNISHLIYLSSDAVYPMIKESISEKSLAVPCDLYGLAHFSREFMLKHISNNFPLAILRSTLIYGLEDPHNSYGPNRLRRMAFNENKIVLFGKGKETRDFVYIDDLINLICLIILYRSEGLLNVASGISITYDTLAKKIASFFNTEIPIEYTDQKNEITHRHFDISLIKKAFISFSFTSIDEGLKIVHLLEEKNRKNKGVNSYVEKA
jgi:nucleoside-diphosphate-sugar epimerase